MKVVVCGHKGFIGTHLQRELEAHGHTVHGLDLKTGVNLLVPGLAERWIGLFAPDVVIHLAAQVGRQFGEDDPVWTIKQNAGMTTLVAQATQKAGARLMYASTSEVYGDRGNHLCQEDEPFYGVPHNLYGLSKRWGEEACQLYSPEGLVSLRFSMPYGPGLPAGTGRAALINFLYNALHNKPLLVHENSERSWCYITETVRAVRILMESGKQGAFNIGRDDNALPMRNVAEMACDLAGASQQLIYMVPAPERQTVVKRLSTDKIRSLGWNPEISLQQGMRMTLEFVKTL